jgi:hypothetical protein
MGRYVSNAIYKQSIVKTDEIIDENFDKMTVCLLFPRFV